MRRAMGKGRKARGKAGPIRAEALGEELAERLTPRTLPPICYEHYGPDGEIEEVWGDRHPGTGRAISLYVVTRTGYAPPKEDWRERGVIPPKGWHRRGEGRESGVALRLRSGSSSARSRERMAERPKAPGCD